MRNGKEHEVARIESGSSWVVKARSVAPEKPGYSQETGVPASSFEGDSDELEVGMAQGDPRQLDAGEPRRAYDARRDRHVDRLRSARHGAARFVSALRSICASAQSKPFAPLSIILRKKRGFDKVRSENSRARSKGDAARGGEKGAPEGEGPWRVRTTAMGTCRRAAMRSASGPRFCRACAGGRPRPPRKRAPIGNASGPSARTGAKSRAGWPVGTPFSR